MYTTLPTGHVEPWIWGGEKEKMIRRFKGKPSHNSWGTSIIGKYGPVHTGGCESEMTNVAILASCGPLVNELIDCYLFVGTVNFSEIATLLRGGEASEYSPDTPMHLVITHHKEGCTVHDYFKELSIMKIDLDRLNTIVAKVLISIFQALIVLRDIAGSYHNDCKLDNMLLSTTDWITFKVTLFDFELANLQSRPNTGVSGIVGFAASDNYWDCFDSFDVHTVVEHGAVYCGKHIGKCRIFEHLRSNVFKKQSPPCIGKNVSGTCNVYLEENHPDRSITFERAIQECRQFAE